MPFAGYKDFDDCVRKNSDKKDPRAYCGTIQHKVEGMEEFTATELIDANEAEFSVEEGTGNLKAKIVLIKAGKSKNRRVYRESALKEAVDKGIYNGLRMFVNHSEKLPLKRSLDEMVAAVESTEWDDQRKAVVGSVDFFKPEFYDFAKRAKNYMGTSVNHLFQGTRKRLPGGVVEEEAHHIVQGRSVDWVVFPAAGGEILAFESESGEEEVDWDKLTLDDLRANAPELFRSIQEASTPPKDGEGTAEMLSKEDVDDLIEQKLKAYRHEQALIQHKQDEAAQMVREAFSKVGLPEKTKARLVASFEGLQEYTDETKDQITSMVAEAQEELKAAGAKIEIDLAPSGGNPREEKEMVFSVKESVENFFGATKKKVPAGDAQKES